MSTSSKLKKVFKNSREIDFDDTSKIVIMSDCHRGIGTEGDNFYKNKNIFIAALRHYYNENYTYIEIGDGDELWENSSYSQIINTNKDVFKLMAKFHQRKQLYMLFGNHDIIKKDDYIRNYIMKGYFDEHKQRYIPLFPNIIIYEGLILKHKETNNKIFITHGHQGDFLNDNAWKITKFLVKYLWHPLESIGIRNPTSAATNNNKKQCIERKLINWTKKNHQMLIAGHTHRPVFPHIGEHLYFNDGCCTKPRFITAIEISNNSISLIKWSIKVNKDRTLYIERDILAGPTKLIDYFDNANYLN
ncbi:MAG: metallophosphoesterase [Bacilli bacterium]|nr:metallophosphoesterase [Bacilli bacterium]MDD4608288.1 metallophosphoesterase [Bacilli bacterium]